MKAKELQRQAVVVEVGPIAVAVPAWPSRVETCACCELADSFACKLLQVSPLLELAVEQAPACSLPADLAAAPVRMDSHKPVMAAVGVHRAKQLARGRWSQPCWRVTAKAGKAAEIAEAGLAAAVAVEGRPAAVVASLADTDLASDPFDCSSNPDEPLPVQRGVDQHDYTAADASAVVAVAASAAAVAMESKPASSACTAQQADHV